jgi:hypothetical protein
MRIVSFEEEKNCIPAHHLRDFTVLWFSSKVGLNSNQHLLGSQIITNKKLLERKPFFINWLDFGNISVVQFFLCKTLIVKGLVSTFGF